jgi:C-terminal processing protease CtpA/Prc
MAEFTAGGMSLEKWLDNIGLKGRVTGSRWISQGLIAPVNVLGRNYITKEEDQRFWARAKVGEFSEEAHGIAAEARNDGVDPMRFGAHLVAVPSEMRKIPTQNVGVLVSTVVPDGAAYEADIRARDIIIQIGDKPVESVPMFFRMLPNYAGQTMLFKIIRGDKTLDMEVRLFRE